MADHSTWVLPCQTGRGVVGESGSDGAMYLNKFAQGSVPLDMTGSDEFRSLLASAADLGIPHAPDVPYGS
jgi:hypothetical protein